MYCTTLAGMTQYKTMKKYKYYTKAFPLPNGKRKYIRAKTKEELEEKIAALRCEMDLGIDICNESTFREYTEYWLAVCKRKVVSDNTYQHQVGMFENHIFPYIGDTKIRDIRAPVIRRVMLHCSDLSKGTQRIILGLMRSVFTSAVDDSILIRSPVPATLAPKGEDPDAEKVLTPEQENALLEAAKGLAVYPFVLTMMDTGMRRGEVSGLMWSDIDFDNDRIYVRRHVVTSIKGKPEIESGAKTAAGVRTIPLTGRLKSYLLGNKARSHSVYVFPTSNGSVYSAGALTSLWVALDRKAGFHTHPHQLRHTYATKLFEAGLDIKQIQYVMGHSDPQTTLRVYTHYRKTMREADTLRQVKAALSG